MPQLNLKDRTIEAKLVYFGPLSSGCRTNLSQLQGAFADGRGAELVTRDVGPDRLLSVKWTPAHLEPLNGCEVAVNVCALQGEARSPDSSRMLFEGADGIVVVLDGEAGALDRNRRSLDELRRACADAGLVRERLPVVLQVNKRDLPNAMPLDELLREMGSLPWPHVEASAVTGTGVVETVCAATQLIVHAIRHPAPETKVLPVPARARLDAVGREVGTMRAEQEALASRQESVERAVSSLGSNLLSALGPQLEDIVTSAVTRMGDVLAARVSDALAARMGDILAARVGEVAGASAAQAVSQGLGPALATSMGPAVAQAFAQNSKTDATAIARIGDTVAARVAEATAQALSQASKTDAAALARIGEALARSTEAASQASKTDAAALARMGEALATRVSEAAIQATKAEAAATRAHAAATAAVSRSEAEKRSLALEASLRAHAERDVTLLARLEAVRPHLEAIHPHVEAMHPRLEAMHPRLEAVHPRLDSIATLATRLGDQLRGVDAHLSETHPRLDAVATLLGDQLRGLDLRITEIFTEVQTLGKDLRPAGKSWWR